MLHKTKSVVSGYEKPDITAIRSLRIERGFAVSSDLEEVTKDEEQEFI